MEVKSLSGSNSFDITKMKDKEVKTATEAIQDSVKETLKDKQQQTEEKKTKEISKADLDTNIDSVNKFLELNLTSLKFQVHENLNRVFVEVVDKKTKEVVRQIPPREFLDMVSSMLEHVGLIVDKKA
ncbi:flagellar protein FlaG [Bacillaceae bacterium IKA-2]|nr:flagellar protein FlaG [Bacillaceae bacterium IKA-2]